MLCLCPFLLADVQSIVSPREAVRESLVWLFWARHLAEPNQKKQVSDEGLFLQPSASPPGLFFPLFCSSFRQATKPKSPPLTTNLQNTAPIFRVRLRLLNTKTLTLTEFVGAVPRYAILSHTWGDQEVSYQEFDLPTRESKRGFAKILGCCRQALEDTLEWVWIDTCCIDKTSSAELSEAINSMYAWYRGSEICYAYLEDVHDQGPTHEFPLFQFRSARWFTRGWCLQELIAPPAVEFYTAGWRDIGTKSSLRDLLRDITAIPLEVLLESGSVVRCTVAERMSWASNRNTTRVEDMAYSLLGIFGVHMPLLYGEGERAFSRLQDEILRQVEDYSFLLWTEAPKDTPETRRNFSVLAPHPACFHRVGPNTLEQHRVPYSALAPVRHRLSVQEPPPAPPWRFSFPAWKWNPPQMTSRGLRVSLPTIVFKTDNRSISLVWTGYMWDRHLVCIPLVQNFRNWTHSYARLASGPKALAVRLVHEDSISAAGLSVAEIYLITHWESPLINRPVKGSLPAEVNVVLSSSTPDQIAVAGCDRMLKLRRVTGDDRGSGSGGGGGVASGTQTWALDGDCRFTPRFPSLDIVFKISGEAVEETVNATVFAIDGPGESKCTIWPPGRREPSSFPMLRQDFFVLRDHAEFALQTGDIVKASIKGVRQEAGHHRFVLRVALLPKPGLAGPIRCDEDKYGEQTVAMAVKKKRVEEGESGAQGD